MTSETHRRIPGSREIIFLAAVLAMAALVLPAPLGARGAGENDGTLTVGAIQFAVSEDIYAGKAAFLSAVNAALDKMEEAAETEAPGRILDLAVFPEYTSAFLALPYLDIADPSRLARDLAANPDFVRDMILRALVEAEPEIINLWSAVAKERGYAILAGTALVRGPNGGIRNRALLFDRYGKLTWTQDKCFPGMPEAELLDLATGKVGDVRAFTVDDWRIVATICRSTYRDVWEEVLPPADLWIDIKANELPYTREYYDQALPERLPNSPIDRGLTVSLSGGILGFRFTGPTEYLYDFGPVAGTDPWAPNAVLVLTYPPERTP